MRRPIGIAGVFSVKWVILRVRREAWGNRLKEAIRGWCPECGVGEG
jgi:hypothetical protein